MGDTQRSQTISTKLHQIAKQAREHPERIFTSLAHLVDVDLLRAAYGDTRKDGAAGVDGVTAQQYAEDLEVNLTGLHARLRSHQYKAPPVKRGWADKEDGSKRPLGIPVFEDKIVQGAVNKVLSAIYEQNFYDFSYGFREGRSQHQALQALRAQCYQKHVRWIIDADVTKFFDNLNHGLLRDIIRKRVNDGSLLRLIGKWLNAGVLEGTTLSYPKHGTPQGGVISPLLANIFLHTVLDEWFAKEIQPRLKGRSFLIRYADDFIIGCELEEDARRIMKVLPKRFGKYDLTIHPKKTVLVDFRSPDWRKKTGTSQHTFDFLGFTHYWAKSRKGNWAIKRKTAAKRLRRSMKAIWQWCHDNRHWSLPEQHRIMSSKLRGHYQYYGIRGNYRMLEMVYKCARKSWKRWLGARSRDDYLTWENFEEKILKAFPLPQPRIVHQI
jgi:group II intron reverse transcriptase/maturase